MPLLQLPDLLLVRCPRSSGKRRGSSVLQASNGVRNAQKNQARKTTASGGQAGNQPASPVGGDDTLVSR